jgi:hypothetical protein
VLLGVVYLAGGCAPSGPPQSPAQNMTPAVSPLGPSYVLVPLPNEDESLLGRIVFDAPEIGRSLDEVSRPNECGDKLATRTNGPLASTFEDAQELAGGGKAHAMLATFGFEGDAQAATHFYYKIEVSKRVAQMDTNEYVACCRERGTCGYGFVSALIYGSGEYATVAETSAEGSVNIPVAGGAGGFVKAKVLHKRNVRGYVAALVTVTGPPKSPPTGGRTLASAGTTSSTAPSSIAGRWFCEGTMDIEPVHGRPVHLQGPDTWTVIDNGDGTISLVSSKDDGQCQPFRWAVSGATARLLTSVPCHKGDGTVVRPVSGELTVNGNTLTEKCIWTLTGGNSPGQVGIGLHCSR